MTGAGLPTGVLAVSAAPGSIAAIDGLLARGSAVLGLPARTDPRTGDGSVALVTWGAGSSPAADEALLLTAEVRHHERAVGAAEVRRALLLPDTGLLAGMLPPFAAVASDGGTLVAAVDPLGMRQLYLRRGAGWVAVSTSARVLAGVAATAVDLEAVAVQSRLGWQLDRRTLFADVEQVPAGSHLTLRDGTVTQRDVRADVRPRTAADRDTTVSATRDLLRGYLEAYLDDHPDPVLQLTGGLDSRLLLSAIAPRRRRGLRVMTLGVPSSPDVAIAAAIARREGLRHEVLGLDGLDDVDPEAAWALVAEAAGRLELLADPVARAALDLAETRAEPGPRISGLGGEVARGFYYLGSSSSAPVTRRRAERLASWRMLANESVAAGVLEPEFEAWSHRLALDEVHRLLASSGDAWLDATDALYLDQRMQRWAGVTETAVCTRRSVANPMLDDRFVAAVAGLSPDDKRASRFLGRLSVALDPGLAGLPLDGRPSPRELVDGGWHPGLARACSLAASGRRKVAQRLAGGRRPPAGGSVLAARLTACWREHPGVLAPVRATGVVRSDWLDRLVAGEVTADAATAALLTNLTLAGAVVERSSTARVSST